MLDAMAIGSPSCSMLMWASSHSTSTMGRLPAALTSSWSFERLEFFDGIVYRCLRESKKEGKEPLDGFLVVCGRWRASCGRKARFVVFGHFNRFHQNLGICAVGEAANDAAALLPVGEFSLGNGHFGVFGGGCAAASGESARFDWILGRRMPCGLAVLPVAA